SPAVPLPSAPHPAAPPVPGVFRPIGRWECRSLLRLPHPDVPAAPSPDPDRKSTRLNSSHVKISYAVFCLKKKKNNSWDANLCTLTTPALRSSPSFLDSSAAHQCLPSFPTRRSSDLSPAVPLPSAPHPAAPPVPGVFRPIGRWECRSLLRLPHPDVPAAPSPD